MQAYKQRFRMVLCTYKVGGLKESFVCWCYTERSNKYTTSREVSISLPAPQILFRAL